MLEEGDLFVCFLGAPQEQPPRVGIWRDGPGCSPIELSALSLAARRTLAAMALPPEFHRRASITKRSEREVLEAVRRPFLTNAALLDARGVEKTARSRGHRSVENELRKHGLSAGEYFTMSSTGVYSAPRVKADVIEVVRAVDEQRWLAAQRLLAVASTPLWRDADPLAIDLSALTLAPGGVTDPTALEMIVKAVRDAASQPPPSIARANVEPARRSATGAAEQGGAPDARRHRGAAAFGVAVIAVGAVIFLVARGGSDSLPHVDVGGPPGSCSRSTTG